ncbi:MAG: DUF4837 family protein [Bacteroidales bacterium]
MKAGQFFIGILTFMMLLTSCGGGNGSKKGFTVSATGAPYELLVVLNKDIWKKDAGIALQNVLKSDAAGLPQSEPNFKVSVVNEANFDKILKPVRNIVITDISDIYTKGSMSYSKDVWSSGQMVLTIKAPDDKTFAEYVTMNGDKIINFFIGSEMNRNIAAFNRKFNTGVRNKVMEMFEAEVSVPSDLILTKEAKDFFWVSNDASKGRMDFVVYSVPYKKSDAFSEEKLIAIRDSVMQANIKGSADSMYVMTTKAVPVVCDTISVHGKFTVRLRGLWEMKNDMMGGPFVSLSRLDEKNQKIITVEGFVFAPSMAKRNLIRRLESMLYTLKLSDELEKEDQLMLGVDETKK